MVLPEEVTAYRVECLDSAVRVGHVQDAIVDQRGCFLVSGTYGV